MKKRAPKHHLEKRPYPGGAQTLDLNTVSQFELFLQVPRATKKLPKCGQQGIKMETWALKNHSGDRFKKVLKF